MLDYIDDAAASGARFTFVDESGCDVEAAAGDLWTKAQCRAAALGDRGGGAPVGAILTADAESCVTVVGAFRAGVDLVSLPIPHRREALDRYAERLRQICRTADLGMVLVSGSYASLLCELVPGVVAMEELVSSEPLQGPMRSSLFTQFTSGTTAEPQGIVHSQDTLLANTLGIIEALEMGPEETVCSWLPFSHDMGLVGVFLTSCVAGGSRWSNGGHAVIMAPERFLRRPRAWMEACSQFAATITVAPSFAYDMATRALGSARLDLSALRACLVGAEPVRSDTLRSFATAAGAHGLSPLALCPTYGLAEAAAAVTMTRPSEPWRMVPAPSGADIGGLGETVSCGRPLPGVSVEVVGPDDAGVGQVVIDTSAALVGRLGGGYEEHHGPIVTNDLGRVVDGELGLYGRLDDVVVVGGRNLIASELEERLRGLSSDNFSGAFAVVQVDGGYCVVVESRSGDTVTRAEWRSIRDTASDCWGIAPSRLALVAKGGIPRTTSGKLRRNELARLVTSEGLTSIEA